jgi:protein-S-isoprenylcysteine O-methyltransferase Ste14
VTSIDRYLVVRAASLYLAVVSIAGVCVWRRPSRRAIAGAGLASCWNVPIVLLLNVAAERAGWWRFDTHGGLLLGVPVDVYLSWIVLWGAVPAIAFPALHPAVIVAIAFSVDLMLMPIATPVIRLGQGWMVGEALGLIAGLAPGQLLAQWTARHEYPARRAVLQMVAFSGTLLFVLPAIAVEASGGLWRNPSSASIIEISLWAQVIAVPAVVGLTAVQEFATRGRGTPVPFDPPERLVTSGIYAYLANPMQLAGVVLLLLWGVFLRNAWVSAIGVTAYMYSLGFAGWDETEDLRRRFGEDWIAYRRAVPRWLPRLRPWYPGDRSDARLFVSARCESCRGVARWFQRRGVRHLTIEPAETHPSRALRRITYEPADDSRAAAGVEAIARALEHIHFGWACVGFALRLPILRELAQLLADASGAAPRAIAPAADVRVER